MSIDKQVVYGPSKFWAPCREGYPDPEYCPDCTPPPEARCPVPHPVDGAPCRVLGAHRFHQNYGRSWWKTNDNSNDERDEADR